MKYVGKNGLKVADKNVWHEGNFDPGDKADTGHNHDTSYPKMNLVNQDANLLTVSGFYHCSANIPTVDGESDKAVIHNQYGSSVRWATQNAISWRNGRMWFRNKEAGTWEPWIEVSYNGHTHPKSQITDMPTKLSQFENDIGAGAGLNIVVSPTEPPQLVAGDWWYKEI